ncbi:bcl-2-related ovarian killer protein isoform X3 [Balaenoptera ricei]|uniref:bcl-2-related ovarian killer protein isoform X3 n=1 Tax=Balaenoptera ricei TaxID=2746895 RepID=UPI0028BF2838|nr:bcl-2-related ovarian killer protein isoform X3 [Balaenoptera ricei]
MEVLRRSSVFAAEIMDAFDRSPTDKELVAQAKALGREFVHARLLRAGLAWSAPERATPAPGGRLAEVCGVLLRLGITWGKVVSLYSVAAGLAVDCVRQAQPALVHALVDCLGEFVRKTLATWLRRRGGWAPRHLRKDAGMSADGCAQVRGQHRPRPPLALARGRALRLRPLPEGCILHAAAREMSCRLGQGPQPGPRTQEALGP